MSLDPDGFNGWDVKYTYEYETGTWTQYYEEETGTYSEFVWKENTKQEGEG